MSCGASLESLLHEASNPDVRGSGGAGRAGGKGRGKKRGRADAGDAEMPFERKTTLRHGQLAPAMLHNPMGRVQLEKYNTDKLWRLLCEGNKYVVSFSELCIQDYGRQQVGISRFAEVMVKCIEVLHDKGSYYRAVFQEKFIDAVMEEAKEVLPSMKLLNVGKVAVRKMDNLRNLAYYQHSAQPAGVREAAEYVFSWLERPSRLKQFLTLYGAGAMLYNAEVNVASVKASCICLS